MPLDEWADILSLVQSALNNALSSSSGNLAPITAFTIIDAILPVAKFLHTQTSNTVKIEDA